MAPRYPETPWRMGYLDGLNERPYYGNAYARAAERMDYQDGYTTGCKEREHLDDD